MVFLRSRPSEASNQYKRFHLHTNFKVRRHSYTNQRMRAKEKAWGEKYIWKGKGGLLKVLVTKSEITGWAFQSVVFMSTGLAVAEARSHFGFIDRLVDLPLWRTEPQKQSWWSEKKEGQNLYRSSKYWSH